MHARMLGAVVMAMFAMGFLLLVMVSFYWAYTAHPVEGGGEAEGAQRTRRPRLTPEEIAEAEAKRQALHEHRQELARLAQLAAMKRVELPWGSMAEELHKVTLGVAQIPWRRDAGLPASVHGALASLPWTETSSPRPLAAPLWMSAELPWDTELQAVALRPATVPFAEFHGAAGGVGIAPASVPFADRRAIGPIEGLTHAGHPWEETGPAALPVTRHTIELEAELPWADPVGVRMPRTAVARTPWDGPTIARAVHLTPMKLPWNDESGNRR